MDQLEKEIIQASRSEGIGSVYERIVLKRFFSDFIKRYTFNSVLEYSGLSITKGFDNLSFLHLGKKVALYGHKPMFLEKSWPFTKKPEFINKTDKKYDLVWNFALVQRQPEVLKEMLALSNKYVLIFVPNFFTLGMPFHLSYHLLFGNKCKHAERGSIPLRTLKGITDLIKKNGVKVLAAGYIDMPLLPDIGFSLRELKVRLGIKPRRIKQTVISTVKLDRLGVVEGSKWPLLIKAIFAHHLYVFGKVK